MVPDKSDQIAVHNGYCKACGYGVIIVLNNDGIVDYTELNDIECFDWLAYCANKSCQFHSGTDWDPQSTTFWIQDKH